MDLYDFIWDHDGDFEKIKEKVIIDFGAYAIEKQRDEKLNYYMKEIQKECKEVKGFTDKMFENTWNEFYSQYVVDGYFEFRQKKTEKIGSYYGFSMHEFPLMKSKTLNISQTKMILTSGKFYYIEKDDYYQWIYDPEKGKKIQ